VQVAAVGVRGLAPGPWSVWYQYVCYSRGRAAGRVQGPGFRVQGSGFRVQGSGSRVQGSGFRVQGVGLAEGFGRFCPGDEPRKALWYTHSLSKS